MMKEEKARSLTNRDARETDTPRAAEARSACAGGARAPAA